MKNAPKVCVIPTAIMMTMIALAVPLYPYNDCHHFASLRLQSYGYNLFHVIHFLKGLNEGETQELFLFIYQRLVIVTGTQEGFVIDINIIVLIHQGRDIGQQETGMISLGMSLLSGQQTLIWS